MKPIKIEQKLRPFSLMPRVEIPLPCAKLIIRCSPTLIEIFEYKKSRKKLLDIKLLEGVSSESFSVFYDIEKDRVELFSTFGKKLIKLFFYLKGDSLILKLDRGANLDLKVEQKKILVKNKEELTLLKALKCHQKGTLEILSFGNHKKQEIERIFDRCDETEFLPLWFAMGQYLKRDDIQNYPGSLVFLKDIENAMDDKKHHLIIPLFKKLFKCSFTSMMIPHLEDINHYGYNFETLEKSKVEPLQLFSKCYDILRKCLIFSENQNIYLLNHLPQELHCGRYINIREKDLHLSLEWSKKEIKKVFVKSLSQQMVCFHLQKAIKTFRLKKDKRDPGVLIKNGAKVSLNANEKVYLDRFEK